MVGAGIGVLIAPFTTLYHTSLLKVLDVISVPLVTLRRLRSSGGTKGQKVGTFKIDNFKFLRSRHTTCTIAVSMYFSIFFSA